MPCGELPVDEKRSSRRRCGCAYSEAEVERLRKGLLETLGDSDPEPPQIKDRLEAVEGQLSRITFSFQSAAAGRDLSGLWLRLKHGPHDERLQG